LITDRLKIELMGTIRYFCVPKVTNINIIMKGEGLNNIPVGSIPTTKFQKGKLCLGKIGKNTHRSIVQHFSLMKSIKKIY